MHGLHAGLARRLERLERRLGAVLEPETDAMRARRAELVAAAHLDLVPKDLTATERPVFSRIVATVPILLELRDEGIIDGYLEDGDDHRDDHRDDRPHEDEDEDEDGDDFGEQRYSVGWPRDRPERKGPRGAEYMGA